jgi:protein CpxP
MKKLLVIAIALCTLTSVAQQERRNGKHQPREVGGRLDNVSPEERAKLQSKQMTLKLDLTNQQQEKIESVLLANYKEGKSKMDAHKASGTKPTKEERTQLRLDRVDAQIALKREMKSILNAEQYKKFEQGMKHRQGRSSKGKKRGNKRK